MVAAPFPGVGTPFLRERKVYGNQKENRCAILGRLLKDTHTNETNEEMCVLSVRVYVSFLGYPFWLALKGIQKDSPQIP